MKTYTTERGIEIRVTPIPLLLEKVRDAHDRPEPPTYAEKTASGAERQVAMVEEDMKAAKAHNPDWYAQHAEVWEAYEVEAEKSETALNEKLLNTVCLKAVQVEMPKDDDWIEEQLFLGIQVPEGKTQRRVHYVKTEVIGGSRDIIRLMALAAGAEVSEEVLAQAEGSFRNLLQGNLAGELVDQAGAVASEPATDAAPGSG